MRAHTYTHRQVIFCLSSCLYDYSFFTNNHQPIPFFLAYTHTRTHTTYSLQTHQNGAFFFSCYTRTVACERVFSIYFAATTITIRHHHIHSRRPYTKQSRASYTYMHDRCSVCVCVSCLKKKREEKAKTYVHTYRYIYICIYTYIRHVRAFSFAVDSFFKLGSKRRENDTPLTDWVTFLSLSLSLCLSNSLFIHLAVFI